MADLADRAIATAGRAMLAAIKDDAKMKLLPMFPRKQPFQIALGLLNAAAVRQPPTLGQPVDMGVDRECRLAKDLRHDHRRGLVPHAGQRFELGKTARYPPAVPFN